MEQGSSVKPSTRIFLILETIKTYEYLLKELLSFLGDKNSAIKLLPDGLDWTSFDYSQKLGLIDFYREPKSIEKEIITKNEIKQIILAISNAYPTKGFNKNVQDQVDELIQRYSIENGSNVCPYLTILGKS